MARSPNTTNFTADDKMALAKLMLAEAPHGHDEWENVATLFSKRRDYKGPERSIPSLKNKWRSMRNIKKPTGKASPTSLASIIMKAEAAITEKSCNEEIGASDMDTENEDQEDEEDEVFHGSRFRDMELVSADSLSASDAAAHTAVSSVAGSGSPVAAFGSRRLSPAMPQPRGSKNSSQLSRFNETFEKFTEMVAVRSAPPSVHNSSITDRLDKMEESMSKLNNVLEMFMAKVIFKMTDFNLN
ncbi:unnamed protein product [Absidia cylindrospora]